MAGVKEAEKKVEEKAEKATKHKVPEGHITPVEATHRLKKETNPKTGKPYAEDKLTSQQVYTLLRTSESNGMPVKHFTPDGKSHKTRQVDGEGNLISRPGFNWDELAAWWADRPARGSKKAKDEEKSGGEASDEADGDDSEDEIDEDELEDDGEEGSLIEAE
ncbi:MAG: hypothetical protein ABSG46_20435 [Candidatus Binataceae bacterium]|jgi:hypothetical protein